MTAAERPLTFAEQTNDATRSVANDVPEGHE